MVNYLDYELLLNKDFLYVLRDLVDTAKRRIYIATYIASKSRVTEDIYYGIAAKQREGVDVKIIMNGASQEALKFNEETKEFLEKLGVKHIKLTKRFTHIKLYIVDDYFIIGSHNLSGSPFMRRFEISIMIHSRDMANKLSELFNDLLLFEDPETLVYRGVIPEIDIYYEVMANYRILRDIYEKTRFAWDRVKILMYIATLSRATMRYYNLLSVKVNEGLDVALLLNGASNLSVRYNKPVYDYLKSKGVERVMLTKDFVHSKLFVIDDFVIVGSHNLTSASIAGRLELALVIKSNNLANALDSIFESIWNKQLREKASGEENE
jgi:phosphatidylserine/phosphatidylglycerophosphate/cardiolipin synthase-like enzyme